MPRSPDRLGWTFLGMTDAEVMACAIAHTTMTSGPWPAGLVNYHHDLAEAAAAELADRAARRFETGPHDVPPAPQDPT